jgi:acyl-CoA reductase-like NAD-dependent aldehyde dehydrogenase
VREKTDLSGQRKGQAVTTALDIGARFDLDANYLMTVDGELTPAACTFSAYNPATKEVIAEVPDATREQLDRAVDAATRAFSTWSGMPEDDRRQAVLAMAARLEAHAEELMALLTREQGKPRADAEWEVQGSIVWLREIAGQALHEQVLVETDERRVVTRHTPLGVVGAITPWNFPVLLAIWKIAPAMVTGNTMVLKPSPFTSLCTLKLGELFSDLVPPGVLNILSGSDDLGKWMTAHPKIAKIAFTGHTDTGKHVMRSAADNLKRLTLELGGNDPAIVLPNVDVADVAPKLFWAAFQNNGQFCNAAKRIYVHDAIYDEVRDALVAFAQTVTTGNGAAPDTDLGPIQNEPQYNKVKEYFDDCHANGHRFALGGEIDDGAPGWFVPVTIVDDPPEASRIVQEEPFGPIVPLLRWHDEDEVISRANDTPYGLGASVWSADLDAGQWIARQIEAGTVWINEVHEYSPHQAFGGHKQSGVGCENGVDGLAEYTNWQTITLLR